MLASIILDFTPSLFTVGAAQHMACTDILAERWMEDVISPALSDGGVSRPLETLARIQILAGDGWRKRGVCDACVDWLHGQWESERTAIWDKLDGWIVEAEQAEAR